MKKLLSLLLLFVCLQVHVRAQPISTKYIFQYPLATVPPTNWFVLVDPGNGAYSKATIQAIGTVIGNFLNITNGGGTFTNVTVITMTSTTNISQFNYSTNLFVTNENITYETNTYLVSTNVTIAYPGGFTNLNLTASTLMWANARQEEASIPNTVGVLTNGGSGPGWSLSISLTELDVLNFFPTNLFLTFTNKLIATDGNGQETNAGTSARFTFTGNVLDIAAGSIPNADLANSGITIQGSSVALGGSTLAAGSTPAFGGINFTNLGYGLPTNNIGGGALVFGGPGTAATLYDTNITAATTLKLFDITACGATAGGIKLYCTCSGGTDRILTFPAGCSGAGLGTPPAITITNAKGAFFDVIYKPGATPVTNVFWSPVY